MTAPVAVTHGSEFLYLNGNGSVTPLPVTLRWHQEDPLAVTLRFPRSETWVFARELLIEGLTSATAGEGDVRFSGIDACPDCVLLTLDAPSGHAELHVDRTDLIDFIMATEYVPAADPDPLIGWCPNRCPGGAGHMPDGWLPGLDDSRWAA